MLVETEHKVSIDDIDAIDLTTIDKMKTPINEPTGSFFYDNWNIKEEYKNTPWATVLNTLPFAVAGLCPRVRTGAKGGTCSTRNHLPRRTSDAVTTQGLQPAPARVALVPSLTG